MRGNLRREPTDEVELARVRHSEECELRLARIQNGAEPSHKNGAHVVTLVSLEKGCQWSSTSGRKSPAFRSVVAADEWRQTHPAWD